MKVVKVINTSRSTIIAEHMYIADTSLRRMIGLLGRKMLEPGAGLWIRPSSGVHTVGMKFPIDVIGLDKSLQIVKLWRNLAPQRITSVSWKLRSVLELPAGKIAQSGSEIGDTIMVSEINLDASTAHDLNHSPNTKGGF